jgi:hypothetical protein
MKQPHVHLLSSYRFPTLPQLHPDKVAEWLLSAPKIARDQSPFYWTYLDRPVDNTILLVWQSLSLGSDFPSDGYVWPPQETAFQVEVPGGYVSFDHICAMLLGSFLTASRLSRCTNTRPAMLLENNLQPTRVVVIVFSHPNSRTPPVLLPTQHSGSFITHNPTLTNECPPTSYPSTCVSSTR